MGRKNRFPARIAMVAVAGLIVLCGTSIVHSVYMRPDLLRTPVDRLIENITAQIEKDPKNVKLQINLARTHAMAYAKKVSELEVERRKPNEPWFGYLPKPIPFGEVIKLNDQYRQEHDLDEASFQKLQESAQQHLDASIAHYRQAQEIDPENATVELGLAWVLDQSGESDEAIAIYRKLIASAWDKEKDIEFAGLTFHSIVAEAGWQLSQKLDPEKDKDELLDLSAKIEKVSKIVRPVTPIAIPLEDNRWSSVYDPAAAVRFDADGSGYRKSWTWIKPSAGWLVYDHFRDGKITSGLQLLGNVSFWCFWDHGYQALAALDDNQDGWLRDAELRNLAIWRDANQNGISELGEVRPLTSWGIVGLSCACQSGTFDDRRIEFSPAGCEMADGRRLPTYDVVLERADIGVAVAQRLAAANE